METFRRVYRALLRAWRFAYASHGPWHCGIPRALAEVLGAEGDLADLAGGFLHLVRASGPAWVKRCRRP